MTERRYDFAPLEALVRTDERIHGDLAPGQGLTVRVAAALGTSARQIVRWRLIGVTADQADRLAVTVNHVAVHVWPELGDDLVEAVLVDCAFEHCDERFVVDGKRKYCSDKCRQRAWRQTPAGRAWSNAATRRSYAADPQRQIERVSAYRRDVRERRSA